MITLGEYLDRISTKINTMGATDVYIAVSVFVNGRTEDVDCFYTVSDAKRDLKAYLNSTVNERESDVIYNSDAFDISANIIVDCCLTASVLCRTTGEVTTYNDCVKINHEFTPDDNGNWESSVQLHFSNGETAVFNNNYEITITP